MNTREKLDRLAGLYSERQIIRQPMEAMIENLKKEMEKFTWGIDAEIKELEKEIKLECLDLKQTIEGERMQVIYYRGRHTVDGEYIKRNHPDIYEACCKISEPYAVIGPILRKEKEAGYDE